MADYEERVMLVEVADFRQRRVMQAKHATFKVPYSSLARILKVIKLRGGKIVRIQPLASSLITETREPPLLETGEPPSSEGEASSLETREAPSSEGEPPSSEGESPSDETGEAPSSEGERSLDETGEAPSSEGEPPSSEGESPSETGDSPSPETVESAVSRQTGLPGLMRRLLGKS